MSTPIPTARVHDQLLDALKAAGYSTFVYPRPGVGAAPGRIAIRAQLTDTTMSPTVIVHLYEDGWREVVPHGSPHRKPVTCWIAPAADLGAVMNHVTTRLAETTADTARSDGAD